MSQALFETAQAHFREGRMLEALAAFAELTGASPEVPGYWRVRAVVQHQSGDAAAAAGSIQKALDLDGGDPQAWLVAGHVAEDLGDRPSAEAHFRRATDLRPGWAPAWSGLGTLLLDDGRPVEALESFQRALDLSPQSARAWNNLGMALVSQERIEDAVRAFNQAVSLDARYALPRFNLARIHDLLGDTARALEVAQHAVQIDPRHVEAHLLIGDVARRIRDYGLATRSYGAATALSPAPKAPLALADLLWETGQDAQARDLYRQVTARNPGSFKAAVASRLMLPAVYASVAQLEDTRLRYAAGLEELHGIADRFSWSKARDALGDTRWTNFYLAYQGRPDRELQASYGRLLHTVLSRSMPAWFEPIARRDVSGRRIRVGFFSYFFFNCTAGRYFASWIKSLDPARFEVFVYYTNPWIAEDTREIAAAASTFRHLPGRAPDMVAQRVRDDALDILVYPELGMNAETFALAPLRLAPVQVAGWGHPTTTGLPNIDWFVSSAAMEPAHAQEDYREKLALLPGLGTRYAMPAGEESGTRADFGLPEGKRLYLVPQSIFKIHPDNDVLLADVLARDPEGCLVMFAANHDAITDRFVARLAPLLRGRGIEPLGRVLMLPYMPHGAYLRLNRLCDVMLDTVHWSGGNTSLDALACGLPVVTMPGELMRGRQSRGMLELLGVPELVVRDAQAYVELAVDIATDRERHAHLAARIEAGLPQLFERDEPVEAFARFLEEAVRL